MNDHLTELYFICIAGALLSYISKNYLLACIFMLLLIYGFLLIVLFENWEDQNEY